MQLLTHSGTERITNIFVRQLSYYTYIVLYCWSYTRPTEVFKIIKICIVLMRLIYYLCSYPTINEIFTRFSKIIHIFLITGYSILYCILWGPIFIHCKVYTLPYYLIRLRNISSLNYLHSLSVNHFFPYLYNST